MKKITLILLLGLSSLIYSQNYTVEQVEKTNDIKVVANFIKNNPNHPKTPEFRRKLYTMIDGNHTSSTKATTVTASPKTSTSSTKSEGKIKNNSSGENKKTAELLTHLFNNDPAKKEAYIHIKNQSQCAIVVKISGKKQYSLNVPARNSNYLLLPKGSYTITTTICGAKYSEVKNLQKDMEITLNAAL